MDPNATLAEMDEIMKRAAGRISHVTGTDRARLRELTAALRSWQERNGFEPQWNLYPYATSRYCHASRIGSAC